MYAWNTTDRPYSFNSCRIFFIYIHPPCFPRSHSHSPAEPQCRMCSGYVLQRRVGLFFSSRISWPSHVDMEWDDGWRLTLSVTRVVLAEPRNRSPTAWMRVDFGQNFSSDGNWNQVTAKFECQWNLSDSGNWVTVEFEWHMVITDTEFWMAHESGMHYTWVVAEPDWQTTVTWLCSWLFNCILKVIQNATNFNTSIND
jgi:hypothetical protein